jgi:poly-gamma-glutamate synthesis protein (capsule biosynthesis protein)
MKRLPAFVVLALIGLAFAVSFVAGAVEPGGPAGSPSPAGIASSPSGAAPSATTAAPTDPGTQSTEDPAPTPTPTAAPTQPPTPAPLTDVAIVPVTQFRATWESTTKAEVARVLAGTSTRYEALELVADEADAILAALGLDRPADPARLVEARDAQTLSADMAKHRKRLALIRADAVGPGVRALRWGKDALFGVDRIRDAAAWRLHARLPAAPDGSAFDPAATWTLFAGGDIMLDRGVYQTIRVRGKGEDFPFDGGTAEITGRTCCSQFGWRVPVARRTGNKGAMRDLMTKADLAIANFENPAPNRFRWHTTGTVFSADPTIIDGLARAGIDYVSLANNHIRDAGRAGILQTMANLDKRGIAHSGAGADLTEARTPRILEANGVKVAILAYDAIARYYFATADRAGSAPLRIKLVTADIKRAREAGADVVIVFPHWGTEYKATPFANQQRLARRIIEAGADMVIGNHAHWAAALEIHDGRPIWYALGNFVFDQVWSEPTMEGITLELTFHGGDLVQAVMRPHIILDKAQPNFLDPAGDGKIVMNQVFGASKGILPW